MAGRLLLNVRKGEALDAHGATNVTDVGSGPETGPQTNATAPSFSLGNVAMESNPGGVARTPGAYVAITRTEDKSLADFPG